MPYIDPKERLQFIEIIDTVAYTLYKAEHTKRPGILNYIISAIIDKYLSAKGMSYSRCNEILGVLEAVKLEFYRRKVADYENQKIKLNGDVYHV